VTCLNCNATTSNGLALCGLCQRLASDLLEAIPAYFRNLARWRPGRAGSRPVPGSRVLYDGERRDGSPDRIARALEDVGNDVATWVRALYEDRGVEVPATDTEVEQITACCELLAEHLTSVATLEWAGVFVHKLNGHARRLDGLTDVVPGWYAGGCKQVRTLEGDLCESGLYVVPGLLWVTCRACGSTTHAADHLDVVLDEARDWIARPKVLAEAIVALVDTEQSVPALQERIKKWDQRGKVTAYRRTEINDFGVEIEVGLKRYRLGDVLDRVLAPETRGAASTAEAS
jgi:hypothetical protein